jgi:hypothetical protein
MVTRTAIVRERVVGTRSDTVRRRPAVSVRRRVTVRRPAFAVATKRHVPVTQPTVSVTVRPRRRGARIKRPRAAGAGVTGEAAGAVAAAPCGCVPGLAASTVGVGVGVGRENARDGHTRRRVDCSAGAGRYELVLTRGSRRVARLTMVVR